MFSGWFKGGGVGGVAVPGIGGQAGIETGEVVPGATNLTLGSGSFVLHSGSFNRKPCSVFICSEQSEISVALGAVKRLKTVRHPSVVTYLDDKELAGKSVTLATEAVVPLMLHLDQLESTTKESSDYLAWGVCQVFKAVGFMHGAGLIHGSLHAGSVFVTPGLEWKIFGFERTTAKGSPLPPCPHQLNKYQPPESGSSQSASASYDVWGLGCLVWEVFNGRSLEAMGQLGKVGSIPKGMAPTYMELVAKNPSKRPDPSAKVQELSKPGGFFRNDLIDTMTFLEEYQIKDESEKSRFFTSLTTKLDHFPPALCTNKILPELIKMFDFGNAGAQILAPIFKIGKHLSSEEYQEKIIPCLVKLFASSDRNARYKLLCQIETFVEHLSNKVANDQVFPQIQNGFLDAQPVIREKTVIAVIHLAPKLSFTNLDETVVMKNFSGLLRDEQAGIRTNTTVCLGKIANHLHHTTRQKVLISAFGGKLKDPFPPARIAAINAFAATQQFYTLQDTSSKIIPMICTLLTDAEKPVRDQAFKVSKGFIQKLEQVSEDPSLKEEMEAEVNGVANPATAVVSGWASWAVGAIGAKFYKSSNQPPPPSSSSNSSGAAEGSGPLTTDSTGKDTPILKPTVESSQQRNPGGGSGGPLKLSSSTSKQSSCQQGSNDLFDLGVDSSNGDGWGNDDDEDGDAWESFEQAITSVSLKEKGKDGPKSDSLIVWGDPSPTVTDSSLQTTNNRANKANSSNTFASGNSGGGWDDWSENASEDTSKADQTAEERKRLREEKRLARQKELEAKRANRKQGGAMKLGSKLS